MLPEWKWYFTPSLAVDHNEHYLIFLVLRIFLWILISKMGVKINLRIITKKSYSWSRNRVSQKIDFKAVWPRGAMPKPWKLRLILNNIQTIEWYSFPLSFLWLIVFKVFTETTRQPGKTGRIVCKVNKQSFLRKKSHFPMKSKRFSF